MEVGLNSQLRSAASELSIKYSSDERRKIDTPISNIIAKLDEYFGDEIDETIIFGSYTRDTISPCR